MAEMPLNAPILGWLAGRCRADNDAPETAVVQVAGSRFLCRFDPDKLREHRSDIAQLVAQLPLEFQPYPRGGGGWSMLNACVRQDGVQWCDFQQIADILACLAIAAGEAKWLFKRYLWNVLPGGMPYLLVVTCEPPLPGEPLAAASGRRAGR